MSRQSSKEQPVGGMSTNLNPSVVCEVCKKSLPVTTSARPPTFATGANSAEM